MFATIFTARNVSKFIITNYQGMELIQTGLSLDCLQELDIYVYIYTSW